MCHSAGPAGEALGGPYGLTFFCETFLAGRRGQRKLRSKWRLHIAIAQFVRSPLGAVSPVGPEDRSFRNRRPRTEQAARPLEVEAMVSPIY